LVEIFKNIKVGRKLLQEASNYQAFFSKKGQKSHIGVKCPIQREKRPIKPSFNCCIFVL